jgi:hypothetical protein
MYGRVFNQMNFTWQMLFFLCLLFANFLLVVKNVPALLGYAPLILEDLEDLTIIFDVTDVE